LEVKGIVGYEEEFNWADLMKFKLSGILLRKEMVEVMESDWQIGIYTFELRQFEQNE